MMKLKSLLMLIVVVCSATHYSAGQKSLDKADKLLGLKAFDLAIKNYESIVANDPSNAKAFAQLGEAYRMSNRPLDAITAYEKAFELSDDLDATYTLQYAHTLKRVGLYAQASAWYAAYSATDAVEADHQLVSVEYAKELLNEKSLYDIQLFGANSEAADFGPAFFQDEVVFSSFRNDIKRQNAKLNDSHIHQAGNQLYKANKENTDQVSFLRPEHKEIYSLGPLSYSKDGRMVVYMRNNFTASSNWIFSDESDMSIYYAFTDETGDFSDAKPFPFNQVEFSYAFPSLGLGGQALYFASNRPGGHGGYDIYVSYLKDGEWSAPENLGPEINTKGNEITPFFDGEALYFSSDYREGMGGYDIFSSIVVDGQWSAAANVGKGLNSPADDYYATRDMGTGAFYYSSNRLGGRGDLDIYVAYPIENEQDVIVAAGEEEVPPAVDLDALAEANRPVVEAVPAVVEEESTEPRAITVSESEMAAAEEAMLFDFSGATFLSAMEESSAEVYFIQLASLTKSDGKNANFRNMQKYGRLYRFFKTNAVKIRLGYYNTRSEAESMLPTVRGEGYRDAFVTSDVLSQSQFDLIESTGGATGFIDDYSVTSKYKVKLASYTDPLQFNVESIKDAGRIEQWTKGQWTIFVLGGYGSLEEAQRARIKAINRGWTGAELVVDEGGVLRPVRTN